MSRADIYYWKCDRLSAFHGSRQRARLSPGFENEVQHALKDFFQADSLVLSPGAGQGNHLTWNAEMDGLFLFIRVENGPEGDNYLEMESALLREVASTGVRVPQVYGCDASRTSVPFAWQALELIPHPDLNHWYKKKSLDIDRVAFEVGQSVATWQANSFTGFGPFDLEYFQNEEKLRGLHPDYPTYFRLRLTEHLNYLVQKGFFTTSQCDEIASVIDAHESLLSLESGCLVHKDLALWNILGSESHIAAFIDFDDAVSGDPMDDLSLLACFHDANFLNRTLEGYCSFRPLPKDYLPRFWLHLLRNLIVKAVIRVGSGYFDRDERLFLIGPGGDGASLKLHTEDRILTALNGLRTDADFSLLEADYSIL